MTWPFRLAVLTDEVSQDIEAVIRFCRDYKLEAVELRSVDDQPLYKLPDERIDVLATRLQEAGLTVCGLSSPVFKCELGDEAQIEEHIGILQRYADLARRFGCRYVRGFSFWAHGPFDEALPRIAERLRGIAGMMEAAGLVYALEFDPAVYATNGAKVRRLLDAVASPHLRALYDPGNDLWDPDGELPYPDGYEHLRGQICHIHLKDAVRTADGVQGVAIGEGEVDYRALLLRLLADGYDGYLVVETHYRLRSQLTEEQLKRPSGSAFSKGGEEASRECMDSLLRLMESIRPATEQRRL
ncbi:sugar phosphate isomerase/epimerase family protein [Paenibacillus elgii]|uniref:sugar phosphate isomerase/epimerase family protein n=1 Tax=Paenibacillus elgii TaxID=189691 RepID=UPI00203BB72F|nr:sugar phosphate isomerase/epimerase family protein [Paenibacillus elgii]MCM3269828.1 sugar phosphate isomerase/epimerase [Paenibacillus elgii]